MNNTTKQIICKANEDRAKSRRKIYFAVAQDLKEREEARLKIKRQIAAEWSIIDECWDNIKSLTRELQRMENDDLQSKEKFLLPSIE